MGRAAGWIAAAMLVLLPGAPPCGAAGGSGGGLLPGRPGALRVGVLGDAGSGSRAQYAVGAGLAALHRQSPLDLVLLLGDNIYGREGERAFRDRFLAPYGELIGAGVPFHAVLGNHDRPEQADYPPFGMGGRRYYSFAAPRQDVRFFALDSNRLDGQQLAWLDRELAAAGERWKVVFLHHPPYSSARRHGSHPEVRALLEPVLRRHRVSLVLAGHDHVYERLEPQHGIHYFVSGGAGKVRRGNLRPSRLTARGYDRGCHYLAFEIDGDDLSFVAVSEDGEVVDRGLLARPADPPLEVGPR